MTSIDLTDFLTKHRLPSSYCDIAQRWYKELAASIASNHQRAKKTIIVGINGAQGSGKSTLADLLVYLFQHHFNLNAVSLSIDDFYLTKQERLELAETVHPLMKTRGVPGTHDIQLAIDTITKLSQGQHKVAIPRFKKADDDRYPENQWDMTTTTVDIVVLEGWCLGASPQLPTQLNQAINTLESVHDTEGQWRRYVNQALIETYPKLFSLIDYWIMLKAPSFDCVYAWRLEQEHKLRATLTENKATMNDAQIANFIQHYQRITEHILQTLPENVDYLFELDTGRNIIASSKKGS